MVDTSIFEAPPVCVVGNINRDVKVQNVPASPCLFEDGETSVPAITETIGGGGANSACAGASLGGSIRFIGKVGRDALGERLQQAMEGHGVRMHLARDPECATGTTVALGIAGGHRHFLSCLPNNENLRCEDLDLEALDGCFHLLRADVWFSQSMLEGGNARLFKEAQHRGVAISLDLNFDPCWLSGDRTKIARRKELLLGAMESVDLAHGNVRELCELTNSTGLEAALGRLTDAGAKAVVVHLGACGAGFWADGKLLVEAACPVDNVVNSTGTGDVLSMCMILLHARTDMSVQEKLRLSNQVVSEFMEGRRRLIPQL